MKYLFVPLIFPINLLLTGFILFCCLLLEGTYFIWHLKIKKPSELKEMFQEVIEYKQWFTKICITDDY